MSILHFFLVYFVFSKIHVICGQSPAGRYACGPPVFQALSPYQISGRYLLRLTSSGSDTIKIVRTEGFQGIYGDSKFFSDIKDYFECSVFRFPSAITVILFENEIFRGIFKDSGQYFHLQLLKLRIFVF